MTDVCDKASGWPRVRQRDMKTVLLALDSFKGSLTSLQAGRAAARGIRRVCPGCHTVVVPVSDGGEGMLDVLQAAGACRLQSCAAHDPLMRPMETCYGVSVDGRTAYIETARAIGLPLLAARERNPLLTTSCGAGDLIADALQRGCRRFVLGLGGSATCDAGTGMLRRLGYRFFDAAGHECDGTGGELQRMVHMETGRLPDGLCESTFVAACDVNNPLFGPLGAARVFAPQKGADARQVESLDAGLRQFARMAGACMGVQLNAMPGAGAAGGLGAALCAFWGARLQSGAELLLGELDFDTLLAEADCVVTGEGHADRQTLMGKVPQVVLQAARSRGVPVILLAGGIEDSACLLAAGFHRVRAVVPAGQLPDEAMQPDVAIRNIEEAAAEEWLAF